MKRAILIVIFICFTLFIACSYQDNQHDIIIEQNEGVAESNSILSVLADYINEWNITINHKNAEMIEVVIDHYKQGKKQEPIIQMSTVLDKTTQTNNIQMIIAEQVYQEESKWIAALIEDDSITSSYTFAPSTELFDSKTYSSIAVPDTAQLGEHTTVGAIILTDSDHPIDTGTFLQDDISADDISEDEEVYIIRLHVN